MWHFYQEWLAECYRWVRLKERTNDGDMLDYAQLIKFTTEQILGSNLADSTAHGTGFGPAILPTTGYLQGLPLLVQIVSFTEVIRPHKSRAFKLKLSDGEKVVDAVALAPASGYNFDFHHLQLGYKVSQISGFCIQIEPA